MNGLDSYVVAEQKYKRTYKGEGKHVHPDAESNMCLIHTADAKRMGAVSSYPERVSLP